MELDLRVRHALHRLVRELGVEAINDAPRVRAALADLLAMEARALDRQIQAVAEAADAGVVRAIQGNLAADDQLASRLLDRGLDESTAQAIVEGWRDALGVPSPGRPGPAGPTTSPPPPSAGAPVPPITTPIPTVSDETLSGPSDPASDATLAGPDGATSGPPSAGPPPSGEPIGQGGGAGAGSGSSGGESWPGWLPDRVGGWPIIGGVAMLILIAALLGWALGRDPDPVTDPAGTSASESEEPSEEPSVDDTEMDQPGEPADPPSSEAPPSSPEPSGEPDGTHAWTAEEERLLQLVPNLDFRNACEPLRDGADGPGEIGEIRCQYGGTIVYYQLYATLQELNQRFAAQQRPGLLADGNDCADPEKFNAEATYQAGGETDGDLRCYFDSGGDARLTWTDWSQRVWAHAVRTDGDAGRLWGDWFELGPLD